MGKGIYLWACVILCTIFIVSYNTYVWVHIYASLSNLSLSLTHNLFLWWSVLLTTSWYDDALAFFSFFFFFFYFSLHITPFLMLSLCWNITYQQERVHTGVRNSPINGTGGKSLEAFVWPCHCDLKLLLRWQWPCKHVLCILALVCDEQVHSIMDLHDPY